LTAISFVAPSPPRTILDLAAGVGPRELEQALAEAYAHGWLGRNINAFNISFTFESVL
jgi:hypothetical protein